MFIIYEYVCENVSCKQAPEVLETKEYEPRSVDVWEAGVVLFMMLTGTLPFGCTSSAEDMLERMKARLDLSYYSSYLSAEAQAILRGMLCYSPKDRFSINRIRQSDWLQQPTADTVAIGNFYLARNPRKAASSAAEELLKTELGI